MIAKKKLCLLTYGLIAMSIILILNLMYGHYLHSDTRTYVLSATAKKFCIPLNAVVDVPPSSGNMAPSQNIEFKISTSLLRQCGGQCANLLAVKNGHITKLFRPEIVLASDFQKNQVVASLFWEGFKKQSELRKISEDQVLIGKASQWYLWRLPAAAQQSSISELPEESELIAECHFALTQKNVANPHYLCSRYVAAQEYSLFYVFDLNDGLSGRQIKQLDTQLNGLVQRWQCSSVFK